MKTFTLLAFIVSVNLLVFSNTNNSSKNLHESTILNYQNNYLELTTPTLATLSSNTTSANFGYLTIASISTCENFDDFANVPTTNNFYGYSKGDGWSWDDCSNGFFPDLINGYNQTNLITTNSSPSTFNLPFIDLTNGSTGSKALRVGQSIPNFQDGSFIVRKYYTALTTAPINVSFDAIPVHHFKGAYEHFGNIEIHIARQQIGSPPATMAYECIGAPSSSNNSWYWAQFGQHNFRYLDWQTKEYSFYATAGDQYFIDFIARDCEGEDNAFLYIDNLCIEEKPIIAFPILALDDSDCDETIISASIDTYMELFNPLFNTLNIIIKHNGNTISTLNPTSPGVSVQTGTSTSNGYIPFTILINNNLGYFPLNNSYDVELSIDLEGPNSDIHTVINDMGVNDGLNNDGGYYCCDCGSFTSSSLSIPAPNPNIYFSVPFENNETIEYDIHINDEVIFNFEYICSQNACDVSIDYFETTASGNITTSLVGNKLRVHYTGHLDDVNSIQSLTIYPKCGTTDCPESRTVYFEVGHCECVSEPIIELINPDDNSIEYSSTYSDFGQNGLPIICSGSNLLTISSPCGNGCYDCTAFDVLDHNLNGANFTYNKKTKKLEISFKHSGPCYYDLEDNYWIKLAGNCKNEICEVYELEFLDCYADFDESQISDCMEFFDQSLRESIPGSGVYDVFNLGIINYGLPNSAAQGPNLVRFIFPPDVLINSAQPSTYGINYLPDFLNTVIYDDQLLFPIGDYSGTSFSNINVPMGTPMQSFDIKVDPEALIDGFPVKIETHYLYSYNLSDPDNTSYTEFIISLLDNGYESIKFCESIIMCVGNELPMYKKSQTNTEEQPLENYDVHVNDESIQIISKDNSIQKLSIINSIGQSVFHKELTTPLKKYTINTNSLNLAMGMYVLNINNNFQEKLIIK